MTARWSLPKLGTGFALAVWAIAFWYLIATDRVALYFSSRTTWLAPMGAIALTVAMAGQFLSARVSRHEPFTRGHLGTLLVLIVPALIITTSPPVALGSFAVSRRPVATNGDYVSKEDVV